MLSLSPSGKPQGTMDREQPQETPTGGGGEGSGEEGLAEDNPEAIETSINVALDRELIHLYLRYDVYDSPVPATFVRSESLPLEGRTDKCMTLVATSEIGKGSVGTALRGTLELHHMDVVTPLDVVLKLALRSWQRDCLKSEYKIYLRLKSKRVQQGITPMLGHFEDLEGTACALVMLYAGVPISDLGRKLTISECDSALSTLKSIHRAGVIHGDIRSANVLIGDSGVTIIDFANAEQSRSKKAKEREYADLRSILQDLVGED